MIHGLEIPVSVVFAYTIHPAQDSEDSELAILLFTVNDITDTVYVCEICFKRFLLVLVTNNINDGGGGDGNDDDDDDDDDLRLSKYIVRSWKYLMLQNKIYTMVFNSVH